MTRSCERGQRDLFVVVDICTRRRYCKKAYKRQVQFTFEFSVYL